MADGLNRVILIGNLGQDPEVRYATSGGAILNMRLATSESWFDKETQERKEKTEWHTVVMFGKRAESLGKFLSKGSKLCAEGRLQTRSWEDKTGAKRYSTEVVANNVVLLGGKRDGASNDNYTPPQSGGGGGFGDDDIPF